MIEDDFYITDDKVIRHIKGQTNTYTVLELHRFLDIISPIPSIKQTDHIIKLTNGYSINDETAKFLKDGSIIQGVGKDIEIWT